MSKQLSRLKAIPWAILLEAGLVVRGRWRSLPQRERAQLIGLARRSRGRPGNLSPKERAELRRLITRLDARGLAGEIAALRRATRKTGKGRRGATAHASRLVVLARRGR
jgi:hypothetical protein